MKRSLFVFITTLFLFSCSSSSKQLESGNYDAALKKSAKKIKKNPGKFEEVDTFNDAYKMAYNRDNDEINRLKQQGNPANWSKIYVLYLKMKSHQDLAASLPPVGVVYEERNFNNEIATAKTNATQYAYAKGENLLAKNDRFEARKAYAKFQEVKRYDANFKDVNEKLKQARFLGTTNVFFRIENNANIVAPKTMMEEIQNINIDDLDKKWLNYDSYIDTTRLYHYSIILNIKVIAVSPEQLTQKANAESKEIEDGFDYVLDANGNVKKDSLGNDIKVTKYKTIRCKVIRYKQKKTARITGTLDYYDNASDKLMKSEPVTADATFEHFYSLAKGNLSALNPETKKELKSKPLPFPTNETLIVQAGNILKGMTKEIIVKNKRYLK